MLVGNVEDVLDRLLDPQVEHRVAVVRQDDVDEVLADVVHVAAHGGEHDLAARVALGLLHVRLEVAHGGLHRLRRLQHERQLHLAAPEQVAHDGHAGEQVDVDDLRAAPCSSRASVQVLGPGLRFSPSTMRHLQALEDVLGDLALGLLLLDVDALEQRHERLQRIVALAPPVEDQVLGRLARASRRCGAAVRCAPSAGSPRSDPASCAWCMKTEFRTWRAAGFRPNEMFDSPSSEFTPGSSACTRRMPSSVSIPRLAGRPRCRCRS